MSWTNSSPRSGDKRPVNHVYPVIFIGCIVVKIRNGQVANRPVIGVSVDGERDILGLWAGTGGEGEILAASID